MAALSAERIHHRNAWLRLRLRHPNTRGVGTIVVRPCKTSST